MWEKYLKSHFFLQMENPFNNPICWMGSWGVSSLMQMHCSWSLTDQYYILGGSGTEYRSSVCRFVTVRREGEGEHGLSSHLNTNFQQQPEPLQGRCRVCMGDQGLGMTGWHGPISILHLHSTQDLFSTCPPIILQHSFHIFSSPFILGYFFWARSCPTALQKRQQKATKQISHLVWFCTWTQ